MRLRTYLAVLSFVGVIGDGWTDPALSQNRDLRKDATEATKEANPVWNPQQYGFIKDDASAPDTVNPSLWRQSQLAADGRRKQ